jgi:hypothetical protein
MQKQHLRIWISAALAAGVICVASISATAGAFTRGCAARDLQVLMQIEERESSNALSPEALFDAFDTMLRAQMICQEGHAADALALYDKISRSLTSKPRHTSRPRDEAW